MTLWLQDLSMNSLKKMLKKLLTRLRSEASQRLEDLADKFTFNSAHRLRADCLILLIILLIFLGGSRAFTHGLPKHLPPAFMASMTKLSAANKGLSPASFTDYHWKSGDPYLFSCKEKGYKCQPISLNEVLQEYPSTEDSLTALQQCLMKSQYHFQQHHETCLNFSSLVRGMQVAKLHGGEIQIQELSNFEQNITLVLFIMVPVE